MAASLPPPPRTHAEIHVNALTLEIEPGSIFRSRSAERRGRAADLRGAGTHGVQLERPPAVTAAAAAAAAAVADADGRQMSPAAETEPTGRRSDSLGAQ